MHFRLPQPRDLFFRSPFLRLRSHPQLCYSACSTRDLRGPVTVAPTWHGRGGAGRRFPSSVEMKPCVFRSSLGIQSVPHPAMLRLLSDSVGWLLCVI
ncbi:zinc finger protein 57 [Phyllostomus discolor]|uniref:Zinc finger protein 57 n=1 Tax=Phyllostomus discolor TaxID=89673 RepID=A0A833ZVB9_9CHIR|nr:zinc finger protein 57 [Phyllostomus discolor]